MHEATTNGRRPGLKHCPEQFKGTAQQFLRNLGKVVATHRAPSDEALGSRHPERFKGCCSRRHMGRDLNLAYGHLKTIEEGTVQPTIHTLSKIAGHFRWAFSTLVTRACLYGAGLEREERQAMQALYRLCNEKALCDSDNPYGEILGDFLSDAIGARSENYTLFAESAGFSLAYLQDLLKGRRKNPRLACYIGLANALNMPFPEMIIRLDLRTALFTLRQSGIVWNGIAIVRKNWPLKLAVAA